MDWLSQAQKYKDEMIKDLQTLVDIPSLLDETTAKENAPFGDNLRKVLDVALTMGKRDGFKVKDVDGYVGIIEYGEHSEAIGMLGHLDVVPVSEGWTHAPFTSVIEDGYLFGRGSADDKGPTMAAYYAMRMLKDNQINLPRNIQLILGCDEETGMRCMQYYKQHELQPLCGFVPDATFPVVYAEKGILDLKLTGSINSVIKRLEAGQRANIVIAQASAEVEGVLKKDLFDFYLSANNLEGMCQEENDTCVYWIKGVGAHGARPFLGVNAAWHLINFIGSAYQDEFAHKTALLFKDWMGGSLNNRIDGVYLGSLTLNLGVVKIVDQAAELTIDIRYPNDTSADKIIENIQNVFNTHDYLFSIDIITNKEPLFVDPKSFLIETLIDTYRKYTKDMFTPAMTMSGGTYARTLSNFVGFGAGFPNKIRPSNVGIAHENDEGIKIESLVLASAIYADALIRLATTYENA